jgi:hypothetical protein
MTGLTATGSIYACPMLGGGAIVQTFDSFFCRTAVRAGSPSGARVFFGIETVKPFPSFFAVAL